MLSRLVLTFLLNAAWQLALMAAVAALGDRLLRGTSARYRHRLWVAALALSGGLSLFSISPLIRGPFSDEPPVPVELTWIPIVVSTTMVPTEVSPPIADRSRETGRKLEVDRNTALVLIAIYLLICGS